MKQQIEGHPNFYKDSESKMILNLDSSARSRYQIAKEQAKKNIQNSEELDSIRNELDEIKSLLYQVLNK